MAALLWFASVLIRYTYILPVHGGGQYLFGGTFLFLFYVGILLASEDIFHKLKKYRKYIVIGGLPVWGWCIYERTRGYWRLDEYFETYLGGGFNPPGLELMLYSFLTLMIIYSLFSLLEGKKNYFIRNFVGCFSWLGRYTLSIFMYHLLVLEVIVAQISFEGMNKWGMRICIYIPMLIVPALCTVIVKKISTKMARIFVEKR